MNSYQGMIERIVGLVCTDASVDKNYMLIGDNSSGKSDVLRSIVEKELGQAIYFIDSVNRTFDVNKVELAGKTYHHIRLESREVVEERINLFNFNLQDTFCAATGIEQLFDKYQIKINSMCKELLGRDIRIVRQGIEAGLVENRILIDGVETKLSSGYQAVLRLFCELLFFCDVMQEKEWKRGRVVVDELDEYLSPRYSAQIYNFLQSCFPNIDFFVTTHSLDLVRTTQNTSLIILHDSAYEIYTGKELESAILAEDIFAKLFFPENTIHKSDNDEIDEKLRMLLNLKIAGAWDEKAEMELQGIKCEEIQPHQKLIWKQIEGW